MNEVCITNNCVVCTNDLQNKSGNLKSSVTGDEYKVNAQLTCTQGGIYVINGKCNGQYTGKTIHNGSRCTYHLQTLLQSPIMKGIVTNVKVLIVIL